MFAMIRLFYSLMTIPVVGCARAQTLLKSERNKPSPFLGEGDKARAGRKLKPKSESGGAKMQRSVIAVARRYAAICVTAIITLSEGKIA